MLDAARTKKSLRSRRDAGRPARRRLACPRSQELRYSGSRRELGGIQSHGSRHFGPIEAGALSVREPLPGRQRIEAEERSAQRQSLQSLS